MGQKLRVGVVVGLNNVVVFYWFVEKPTTFAERSAVGEVPVDGADGDVQEVGGGLLTRRNVGGLSTEYENTVVAHRLE